jgi:hypothetical protein
MLACIYRDKHICEQSCFMFYECVWWVNETWCVSNCHSPVRQRGQHQPPWIMAAAEQTSELLLHLTWMWLIAGIKVTFVSLPTLTQFCGLFFQQLCVSHSLWVVCYGQSRCSQKTEEYMRLTCTLCTFEFWTFGSEVQTQCQERIWIYELLELHWT